jgi:hypothetical protein
MGLPGGEIAPLLGGEIKEVVVIRTVHVMSSPMGIIYP